MIRKRVVPAVAFVAAGLCAGAAFAIPAGNYDRSCRSIREGRDSLSASCRGLNGRWVHSIVRFASCAGRVYIQNISGQLRCTTQ